MPASTQTSLSLYVLAITLLCANMSFAFSFSQGTVFNSNRNMLVIGNNRYVSRKSTLGRGPRMLFVEAAREEELAAEGARKVVTLRGIKLVIARNEGKLYAFNNKCPHLGLSLKNGKITPSDDRHGVCIVCPYHKSKFSLEEDGKCKVWSESILGIRGTEAIGEMVGGFVAPMAKQVNPFKKKAAPAVTYQVKVEDGAVLVDLPPDLSNYAQTRIYRNYQEYIEATPTEAAKSG